MTYTPIEVREHPPTARGQSEGDGRIDWSRVVTALREQRGQWMLLDEFVQTSRINSLYRTVTRAGATALRLQGEQVEARVRNSSRTPGGEAHTRRTGDLWLRITEKPKG